MNNLGAIKQARDALLKQNAKCVNRRGTCLYRGSRKLKCGIGHLIPDSIYKESFEEQDIYTLLNEVQLPELVDFFKGVDIGVLRSIQKIHDDDEPENWERSFEHLLRSQHV